MPRVLHFAVAGGGPPPDLCGALSFDGRSWSTYDGEFVLAPAWGLQAGIADLPPSLTTGEYYYEPTYDITRVVGAGVVAPGGGTFRIAGPLGFYRSISEPQPGDDPFYLAYDIVTAEEFEPGLWRYALDEGGFAAAMTYIRNRVPTLPVIGAFGPEVQGGAYDWTVTIDITVTLAPGEMLFLWLWLDIGTGGIEIGQPQQTVNVFCIGDGE